MVIEALAAAGAGVAAELAALAERVRPSVVEVASDRGGGSGIIWTRDGLIVTNHHVVPGEAARVILADGRRFAARVDRRDPDHDLAVLRVPASDLPAAAIGDSTRVRVGQLVVAVGNPFGVPRAVTVGIISGPKDGSHGRLQWRNGIQAEIELRPGNSGGPLLNVAGEVIAVNAMVIGPRLALSIPSQTVEALLGEGRRRQLGLRVQATPLPAGAAGLGLTQATGLLVAGVGAGTPADAAGLLPGDILVALDYAPAAVPGERRGVSLIEPGDLALAVARACPGTVIRLRLLRAGRLVEQPVTPAG
jgi:serine protease Do